MSNDYFNATGTPSTGASGLSAPVRSEFASISAGFDKLPALTGAASRVVHVNAGATALTTTAGFTFDGTTLTVPTLAVTTVSGTLATLAVTDSGFSIKDNVDATKIAQFQCSSIATGTTRTYTLPNADVTLAGLTLATGGTGVALTAVNGGIVYSNASTLAISAAGSSGQILRSGGAGAPTWSTATYPATAGTSGKVLQSDGTNFTSSTPTWPTAASTAGKMVRSDGTNLVMSTTIWPNSVNAREILFSTSTNNFGTDTDFYYDNEQTSGGSRYLVVGSGSTDDFYYISIGGDGTSAVGTNNDVALVLHSDDGVGNARRYYVGLDQSTGNFCVGRGGNTPGVTDSFRISTSGIPFFVEHDTTASAANAYIDSSTGKLQRSTSSLRYKRNVEPVDPARVNAVLDLDLIWYRSACAGDNPNWSWYGLGAEQVAEKDPRLVHWGLEVVGKNEYGSNVYGDRLVPEGVMYERVAVLTLGVVQRHEIEINDIKSRLAAANL